MCKCKLFFTFFIAILFSGIGDAAVNRFLAALNLPSIDSKTLKKRERKVGTAVEDAAHSSCHDAIEHEKSWYIYLEFEI